MARRLFLERRTYRRNRLQDAARLLPVLGAVLIFAPIFIRGSEAVTNAAPGISGPGLAQWLVYYFVVWSVLIALTALVNAALTRAEPADEDDASQPVPPGEG